MFPNISKLEYTEKNLHAIIPAEKIFFADDLHPASEMCCDPSGKCFLKALNERFPPVFKFRSLPGDFQHLKRLMFPQVRIELPKRGDGAGYTAQAARLKTLDHNQEALARQFDGGHRIIVGPSGSGKTLVLDHKAAFLQRYNPAIQSILFVCYNITLVNYVKRILADKGVQFGDPGVTVCHFYELCAMILAQSVALPPTA